MRCPPCTSRERGPARPLTLVFGPFPAPPPQDAPEDMRSPACCLQTPGPSHPALQAHPPPHRSETSSHAVHPLRGKTLTVPVMPGHHQSAPGVIPGWPRGQLQQTNPDSPPRRTVRVLGTPRPCPESRHVWKTLGRGPHWRRAAAHSLQARTEGKRPDRVPTLCSAHWPRPLTHLPSPRLGSWRPARRTTGSPGTGRSPRGPRSAGSA